VCGNATPSDMTPGEAALTRSRWWVDPVCMSPWVWRSTATDYDWSARPRNLTRDATSWIS
jgi:hypothetical protein